MSTRATYSFRDADGDVYHVYKHYDGYPAGAASHIASALKYAWPGSRFEAAEFAAAFIAANKREGGGDVYFSKGPTRHGDLDYSYTITSENGSIHVTAYRYDFDFDAKITRRTKFYSGPLNAFIRENSMETA